MLEYLRELAKYCDSKVKYSGSNSKEVLFEETKLIKERLLQQDSLDLNKAVRIAKTTESILYVLVLCTQVDMMFVMLL